MLPSLLLKYVIDSPLMSSKRSLWQRKTEQPCQQNLIGVGQFTKIHKLNKSVVRKVPSDKADFYCTRAIEIERSVYKHLGKNKRVARCIAWGDDFVDLQFEKNGDLECFLKKSTIVRPHQISHDLSSHQSHHLYPQERCHSF